MKNNRMILQNMAAMFVMLCASMVLASCAASDDANQQDAAARSATQYAEQDAKAVAPSGLDLVPLTIESGGKTHAFTVEVARTAREQARGLMFRSELAPDSGMIFPLAEPRLANFWMKDTQISLDIIFVRSDGTIESIAANTTPYSLDGVASGEPVAMVLELVGGRAEQLGLQAGDLVKWTDAQP